MVHFDRTLGNFKANHESVVGDGQNRQADHVELDVRFAAIDMKLLEKKEKRSCTDSSLQ